VISATDAWQTLSIVAATAPKPGPPEAGTGFAQDEASVVAAFDTDAKHGLSEDETAARLSRYGPNQITGEKPPSVWKVALEQRPQERRAGHDEGQGVHQRAEVLSLRRWGVAPRSPRAAEDQAGDEARDRSAHPLACPR
jgi:hypothetical protein